MNSSMLNSKKRLFSIVMLCLVIFIASEGVIYILFLNYSTGHIKINNYIKEAKQGKANIVFLGSSIVAGGIHSDTIADVLSQEKGKPIDVYNLGIGATNICYSYFIIKNILSRYKPELIVVSFKYDSLSFTSPDIGEDARYLLPFIVGLDDIPMLFRISIQQFEERVLFLLAKLLPSFRYRYIINYKLKELFKRVIPNMIPNIRNEKSQPKNTAKKKEASNSEQLTAHINPRQSMIEHKGWQIPELSVKNPIFEDKEYFIEKRENIATTEIEETYLSKISLYAKENNLNILFLGWPGTQLFNQWYLTSEKYRNYLAQCKDYVQKQGGELSVFDYQIADSYFLDENHFNTKGAIMFSEKLAQKISAYLDTKQSY